MKTPRLIKTVCIIIFGLITATSGSERKDISNHTSSSAFWGQFSVSGLKVKYHPKGFVKLETNGNYRRQNLLFSAGYVKSVTESWKITNTWLALGWGKYNNVGEISVNGGLSYSGWTHQLWEGKNIESTKEFGGILKINGLLHLIDGYAGIGLDYTIHYSSEIKYQSLSVFIALGNWNF